MLVFSFVNAFFYFAVLRREGVFKKGSTTLSREIKKRIHGYNKSIIAILACDKIVWDKSENFFLGRFSNSLEIGYYNLGYNISQRFTSILPQTFWRVLFPAMSAYFGSGDIVKMKRLFFIATRYLAFVSFPVGTAGIILAYQIIFYLYGHDFTGAQRALQIIFFASIFSGLSNPASAVLYSFEKQSFIYKYGAVLAVINITMDLLLIKQYGAIGAAMSFGVITILGSIGGLVYTCNKMKLTYPIISVFKVMISTVIMGTVIKLIINYNDTISGFITSIVSGIIAYVISLVILEKFEEEDFILLEKAKSLLPGKTKLIIELAHTLLLRVKGKYV
jgi:O-antigen/teichoic acid export membrane protein